MKITKFTINYKIVLIILLSIICNSLARRSKSKNRLTNRSTQPKLYPDGFFNIIGKTGLCVSANRINGALTQRNCGSSDDLLWKAENQLNGLVILCKNGMVFDNSGQQNINGNPTLGYSRNFGPNQVWVIESVQNGNHVHFRNPQTNRCFDDTGVAGVGRTYHIWDCRNENRNQWFRLNPPTLSSLSLPKMPSLSLPKMPSLSLPKMPSLSLPKMPIINLPTFPNLNPFPRNTNPTTPNLNPLPNADPLQNPKPLKKNKTKGGRKSYNVELNAEQKKAVEVGGTFCSNNCAYNLLSEKKKCIDNGRLRKCRRCTSKNPPNPDPRIQEICSLVCNSFSVTSPCDFYGYLNNVKKKHDVELLKAFGLSILKKYFKRR